MYEIYLLCFEENLQNHSIWYYKLILFKVDIFIDTTLLPILETTESDSNDNAADEDNDDEGSLLIEAHLASALCSTSSLLSKIKSLARSVLYCFWSQIFSFTYCVGCNCWRHWLNLSHSLHPQSWEFFPDITDHYRTQ